MGKKLVQPEQITYFICWDDSRSEVKSYSSINTNQTFETYWSVVDYYTDISQWKTVLINNGVDSNELNYDYQ